MSLRTGVLCAALALCIAALAGALTGHIIGWFVALEAAAAAGFIAFERSRYGKRTPVVRPGFEPTDERFIDPTTGRETVVYFNPQTGERDYRDDR